MPIQKLINAWFDLNFKTFQTPMFAPHLFVVLMICWAVMAIDRTIRGGSIAAELVGFIVAIILTRMVLEVALAIMQSARYQAEIARRGRPESTHTEDVE